MKRKTKQTSAQHTFTYGGPHITPEQAKTEFIKAVGPKRDDGTNESQVARFLDVMEKVKTYYPASFTVQNVMAQAKFLNLEPKQTLAMWEKYKTVMESLGKISVIQGCYDDETILVLS